MKIKVRHTGRETPSSVHELFLGLLQRLERCHISSTRLVCLVHETTNVILSRLTHDVMDLDDDDDPSGDVLYHARIRISRDLPEGDQTGVPILETRFFFEQKMLSGRAFQARGAPLREYYLALGSLNASLETLTELILALAPEATEPTEPMDATTLSVSVVVCVSSRDVLDDVVCGLRAIRVGRRLVRINLWSLHSDMLEREVTSYANEFRETARCTVVRNDVDRDADGDVRDMGGQGGAAGPPRSVLVNVLVTTDSPLKTLGKLNSDPLAPTLLIHYSLPRRREEYLRRTSVVLGSRKSSGAGGGHAGGGHARVAVCFVHAGRLDELHAFEAMADRSLLEMPVHVRDIFGGT